MPPKERLAPVLMNWISLHHGADRALYLQLADQIRSAILRRDLPVGAALPSSRALSQDLSVSRATALLAYEVLQADGLVQSRRGVGTWVSRDLPRHRMAARGLAGAHADPTIDHNRKHLQNLYQVWEPFNVAFQPGIPAFDAFPRALWSRLLAQNAARADPFLLDYAHIGGYGPLRAEICKYLRSARGLTCGPEQVIVVSSVRSALAAVSAVLLPRGCPVAVEEPGYRVAQRVFRACGPTLVHVPVDARGLRVDRWPAGGAACGGLYLTPAHHWPTGVALDTDRRARLLDWARSEKRWIIEDDYDSEYRFESRPLAPLHASGTDRVIYVGTFSKTFAPSVRTAYLVVPPDAVERFERQVFLSATEPPLHVQAALSDLMGQGHFTRHILRMRRLYAQRRTILSQALERHFGGRITVVQPPGGLQLMALLPDDIPAPRLSALAARKDIVARSLETMHERADAPNGLHLGFAAVPEERIERAVETLAGIVADHF